MPVASNNSASNQQASKNAAKARPAVLVVDDEPAMLELSCEILTRAVPSRVFQAASIAEARRIIDREPIALLIADVRLPDGDGTTLVKHLRDVQPGAGAIVITGDATLEQSVRVFRDGAIDYLPKPFTAEQFADRVARAIQHQDVLVRTEKRLARLRSAVRKLNNARRTVSKKVDLLCNDLVTAYGDLARQFEDVRVKENFRKTVENAADLEQMLCHTMDWLLRQAGYANIAIYLAGEEGDFELGAYMKYTIAGSKGLTDALKNGVIEQIARDDFVSWTDVEAADALTPAELDHIPNHGVVGVNATYLGESLAGIVLFRDAKSPFTQDDAATLRAIAPIFAHVLTALAKREGADALTEEDGADLDFAGDGADDDANAGFADEGTIDGGDFWADERPPKGRGNKGKDPEKNEKPKKKKADDADWWKRGDAPPY